jgi:hypothetical protein
MTTKRDQIGGGALHRSATPLAREAPANQPEQQETPHTQGLLRAGATGLEPATSGVTGRRSNQLSYAPSGGTGSMATPRAQPILRVGRLDPAR